MSNDLSNNAALIGRPLARVDSRLKVTGQARYAAEFPLPGLVHGVLLQSTIARGRVIKIDTAAAEKSPGVVGILTRGNLMPALQPPPADLLGQGKPGESRAPLADGLVHWDGQPLGVIMAETLEEAQHAASLVRVQYEAEPPLVDMRSAAARAQTTEPETWNAREKLQLAHGDAAGALATSDAKARVEPTYTLPVENHHPIELIATTAVWETPDRLLVYDTTRGIKNLQKIIAASFGLKVENVRVVCYFLGGHFGSKGFIWSNALLTAAAARLVGRPVRLVLSRQAMANNAGQRAATVQEFALAATAEGKLTALRHATHTHCSPVSDFTEACGIPTKNLYACPNFQISHRLTRVNLPTPVPMRAPGKAPGVLGIECAMDELAAQLGVDPLELRLRNYAETDEAEKKPWSSKHLRECYERGAKKFGWSKRNPRPGSTRDKEGRLIGWGMATAVYPAAQSPAAAKATLFADDGRVVVRSATHEAGTGTYTGMTQLIADALALPAEKVVFELGDSDFPLAPVNGGSRGTSSVGPAVIAACRALVEKLTRLAQADPKSPLSRVYPESIVPGADGFLTKGDMRDSYVEILRRAGLPQLEAEASTKPGEEREKFSFESFGAQFVEVRVDPLLGEVRVSRFVGVYDVGRVVNPQLARSQIVGAAIFSIGMALMEGTTFDPRSGRVLNGDLAEYHLPTFADTPPEIDVSFLDIPDPHMPEPFARGIGELAICGTPAAIANAVFHATGKRVREFPITPDKLL